MHPVSFRICQPCMHPPSPSNPACLRLQTAMCGCHDQCITGQRLWHIDTWYVIPDDSCMQSRRARRAQIRLLEKEREALKAKADVDRRRLGELGREKDLLAKQGTQAESAVHRQVCRRSISPKPSASPRPGVCIVRRGSCGPLPDAC